MTTFVELSARTRGMLGLWFVAIMLLACVAIYKFAKQKSYLLMFVSFALLALSYIVVQWCSDIAICNGKGLTPPHSSVLMDAVNWKWAVHTGILFTAIVALLNEHAYCWDRTHITEASLKEGIDNLPTGLLWYYGDGTVALRNLAMDNICRQLTGHDLFDGIAFENKLKSLLDTDNVLTLPDGIVLNINMSTVERDGAAFREICAYDITEEYKTTRELARKQKEAKEANDKLIQYGRELAGMITANEILAAKVRIHDELGQGLLLTRKYLLRGGTKEDKQKLLEVLRKNNSLMESTQNDSGKSYMEMVFEAAQDMGVRLTVEGNMPQMDSIRDVFTTAIHENLTNTIRHAHGNELNVVITKEGDCYTAVFTNNGDKPTGPIEEKGGLAMLRALVMAQNGEMEIKHEPVYKMTIRV